MYVLHALTSHPLVERLLIEMKNFIIANISDECDYVKNRKLKPAAVNK